MTRKYFKIIAAILANYKITFNIDDDDRKFLHLATMLSNAFSIENPKFDSEKFKQACLNK